MDLNTDNKMNKNNQKNRHQRLAIAVVLVIAAVLAGLILMGKGSRTGADEHSEEHGNEAHADVAENAKGNQANLVTSMTASSAQKTSPSEFLKGPHGGKLFTKEGFGLELIIFENEVEPEFRLYTYKDGKALAPDTQAASKLNIVLERLGRAPQTFTFVPEKDYFKGSATVDEPHSFKVTIAAQYNNQSYQFAYEQVEARISMSESQLQQNGVVMATAGPAKIQSALTFAGEIRFNQDRMIQVVPRLTGIVETVSANAGDKVQKGQVLAVISSQALADQRSDMLAAQKRLGLARTNFEREKKLWEEKISAEQDYLQARNAMQEAEIILQSAQQKLVSIGATASAGGNLTRYEIRSPIAGTVTEKNIVPGQSLKDDTPIFIVADLSTVWVEMTVPAKDINLIQSGQKAKVTATAFVAEANGNLSYIGSLVGEQSRTAIARVVLPNTKGLWRPGLQVSINLVSDEVEVPVAVAVDGIQSLKETSTVFGRYGNDFEARPVTLGRSDGKFVEVLKGFNAGERYAAKNSFLIKADIGKSGASHDH